GAGSEGDAGPAATVVVTGCAAPDGDTAAIASVVVSGRARSHGDAGAGSTVVIAARARTHRYAAPVPGFVISRKATVMARVGLAVPIAIPHAVQVGNHRSRVDCRQSRRQEVHDRLRIDCFLDAHDLLDESRIDLTAFGER